MIYLKKEQQIKWPWTKDEILQTYKFTNVYRQYDAVTKEWTQRKEKLKGNKQILWHCAVFRMFNWPNTYDTLKEAGLLAPSKWKWKDASTLLKLSHDRYGSKIFTGAYVITNNGQKTDKIELCCLALDKFFIDRDTILKQLTMPNTTLEEAHKVIAEYPMWGPFTAYELVTDLRWSPILCHAEDIMTWANPGPGAKRGCNRIFRSGVDDGKGASYLEEMQILLKQSFRKGMLEGHMELLEMRDIEHSLCEFDKYMRVLQDQGRPRSKYRRPA